MLILAALVRIGWGLSQPVSDASIAQLPDQQEYLSLARNLLAQALVLDPSNRDYRSDLDEVTAALRAIGPKHAAERR